MAVHLQKTSKDALKLVAEPCRPVENIGKLVEDCSGNMLKLGVATASFAKECQGRSVYDFGQL